MRDDLRPGRSRVFAAITGGGTAGHVSPALAIGEALVAKGHSPDEIEFVGGRHGIEGRLVPEAGFSLVRLPGRGLKRRLSLDNLAAGGGLLVALAAALVRMARRRPRVVVSVGGYAGFAYGAAAALLRVPLVVVTVDAVPGAVNRLLSRHAAANVVSFPHTDLPRSVVTGPPVREDVLATTRDATTREKVFARLGIEPSRRLVVVAGGSLGAASVNAAALSLGRRWSSRGDVAVYHLAGDRNLEAVRREAEAAGLLGASAGALSYRLAGFDSELASALAACDVAVTRAGAMTVAELTALGVPAILVPLPGAPSDHQSRNAAALAEAGACLSIRDGDLASELAAALESLLAEPGRLESMAEAASRLGRRDAARAAAAVVEEAAGAGERTKAR